MAQIIKILKNIWEEYQRTRKLKKWLANGIKKIKENPEIFYN